MSQETVAPEDSDDDIDNDDERFNNQEFGNDKGSWTISTW